jgi:hypothetical protein
MTKFLIWKFNSQFDLLKVFFFFLVLFITVSPWDGIAMPPQIVESNGVENLSTGYVADEW